MKKTKLIFAGGFLGAEKTTLLWRAAREAINKGLNVGLIEALKPLYCRVISVCGCDDCKRHNRQKYNRMV